MRKSKGRKSGKAESDKRDDAQNGDPERDSNEDGENEDSEEDVTPKKSSKSHKRQSRSRDEDEDEDEHEDDQEDEEENDEKPAKKSKKRKSPSKKGKGKSKKSKKASESEDNSDDEDSGKTSKKGRKTAASKKDDSDDDDDEEEVSKEEYEVARIIDVHFKNNGEREFLVRWKGYSSKDDTWEPEAHLNCKDLIAAYLKKCEEVKAKQKRDEEDDGEEVSNKEYEVSRIIDVHFKNNGKREFLVRWKGYSAKDDTWEPEEHLNCKDLINAYLKKCEEARNTTQRETRINRKRTDRFIFNAQDSGRKLSGRHKGKPRKTYFEEE